MVLSPYHPSLAAHCLLCSSHLSLAHKATAALGKKIRKQSHEDSSDHRSFQDVMMALQDSSEGCPEISDPLVQAREVLRPSVAPPPLSHTLSLLSSLPDGCQFNIISLAPTLICQVLYILDLPTFSMISLSLSLSHSTCSPNKSTYCCVWWVKTESPCSLSPQLRVRSFSQGFRQ